MSFLGISERTIRQIKQEGNTNSGIWRTPGKKRKCNAFASISANDWQKCADHVKKLEAEHRQQDRLLDNLEPFVFRVESDDDSEDEMFDYEVREVEEASQSDEEYEGIEFLDSDVSFSE